MATSHINRIVQQLHKAVLTQVEAGWTDGQLLKSFVEQRDVGALEILVRRHAAMVWGVCRRVLVDHHDAEDALQATFLVLFRKAACVKPRDMLANWLYGVAYQTARKARATTTKRRQREKQVTEMPELAVAKQDLRRDLQPLLDQELGRLPDKYRVAVILCDLEGKSRKEAAEQLGLPEGTVASRLARARAMLAKRLARHGFSVSGGALAVVLSQKVASAGVPTWVVSSTIKATGLLAAGQATVAGAVPPKVAILTEGVLEAMFLTKLKSATVGLILLALLIGAAAIYQTQAAEQSQGEQRDKAMTAVAPPPKAADQREYVIRSKLMEAGAEQPKEVLCLPKMTLDDGQVLPLPLHIPDGPQNLLAKVVLDEKIKIGTFFDVRVERLGGNKVRLFLSFQRNEVEKANVSEIRVLGSSVQAIQDVELVKPVKMVLQKDAKGSAQRWVEITVDEITADEQAIPAPPVSLPQQKGGKK